MAIYTFGIVRTDIGRLLPKIAFANDSTPTSAQADSIIEDHAAEINGFLEGMGVSPQGLDAQPTMPMYRMAGRYILLKLAADVVRMRNQNSNTAADEWDKQAYDLMDRLRKLPQDLGETRPTGINSPNILHTNADYPQQIYNASIASGSRLAINAINDKM
jgi:hypothetical protein